MLKSIQYSGDLNNGLSCIWVVENFLIVEWFRYSNVQYLVKVWETSILYPFILSKFKSHRILFRCFRYLDPHCTTLFIMHWRVCLQTVECTIYLNWVSGLFTESDDGPIPEQRLVNMNPSMPLLLKNFPSRASSSIVLKQSVLGGFINYVTKVGETRA